MKLHRSYSLTKVLPMFRRIFPSELLKQLEQHVLPAGDYDRKAFPRNLTKAVVKALILRLSCLEELLRESPDVQLSGPSSLSYDLRKDWFLKYASELNSYLGESRPIYEPAVCRHPRMLIDTMPVLLQITQRGTCKKYNNVAKGCGVMAAFNLDAHEGQSAVKVMKVMHGGWNDTFQVRSLELIRNGPIYIADRGFYSLETMHLWREQSVHFIVRAKKHNLSFTAVRPVSLPAPQTGSVRVESDEIVILGKPTSEHRSEVRLVRAWLAKGENLWLVTDQYDMPVDQLLENYHQRGIIEVYHRFLKQTLGAAHLFNFDANGIESQIQLTILLTNLLFLSDAASPGTHSGTLKNIVATIETLRRELGLHRPWKRNTVAQRRNKPLHNRRRLKRRATINQQGPNL